MSARAVGDRDLRARAQLGSGACLLCAERSGGGFLISGQTTWCSSAHLSKRIPLVARTSREQSRPNGLTMLEVRTDGRGGVEIRPIEPIGGREVNDVFLTDACAPCENIVGEVGKAWKQVMAGLNGERVVCTAQGIGMALHTLDDVLAYMRERKQFGKPIGTFQALSHRIADLAIEVGCSRLITRDVAARIDAGRGTPGEVAKLTSMAKVKVTETAKKVSLEGMQMTAATDTRPSTRWSATCASRSRRRSRRHERDPARDHPVPSGRHVSESIPTRWC